MNPSLFVLKAPPAVPDYAPCNATCDTTCDATSDATGGTSCDPVSPKDAVHEQAGFLRASVAGADVATPEGGVVVPRAWGREQRAANHRDDAPDATRVAFRDAAHAHTSARVHDEAGHL